MPAVSDEDAAFTGITHPLYYHLQLHVISNVIFRQKSKQIFDHFFPKFFERSRFFPENPVRFFLIDEKAMFRKYPITNSLESCGPYLRPELNARLIYTDRQKPFLSHQNEFYVGFSDQNWILTD